MRGNGSNGLGGVWSSVPGIANAMTGGAAGMEAVYNGNNRRGQAEDGGGNDDPLGLGSLQCDMCQSDSSQGSGATQGSQSDGSAPDSATSGGSPGPAEQLAPWAQAVSDFLTSGGTVGGMSFIPAGKGYPGLTVGNAPPISPDTSALPSGWGPKGFNSTHHPVGQEPGPDDTTPQEGSLFIVFPPVLNLMPGDNFEVRGGSGAAFVWLPGQLCEPGDDLAAGTGASAQAADAWHAGQGGDP